MKEAIPFLLVLALSLSFGFVFAAAVALVVVLRLALLFRLRLIISSNVGVFRVLLFTYSCLAPKLYISCSSRFYCSSFPSCFLAVLLAS